MNFFRKAAALALSCLILCALFTTGITAAAPLPDGDDSVPVLGVSAPESGGEIPVETGEESEIPDVSRAAEDGSGDAPGAQPPVTVIPEDEEPAALAGGDGETPPYVPGEVIVVFNRQVGEAEAAGVVASVAEEVYEGDITPNGPQVTTVVALPEGQSVEEAVAAFDADPSVAHAQPNYIMYATDAEPDAGEVETQALPSDPLTASQWHLGKIGVSDAWDLLAELPAGEKVRVAILDSTADPAHPDLAANVNAALSKDFADPQNPVPLALIDNTEFHGTHVAGIAGAVAGNNVGGTGVASGMDNSMVELVLLSVFYTNPNGERVANSASAAAAIDYAISAQVGARVINMSFGVLLTEKPNFSDAVDAAMQRARAAGALPIVSAGNNGVETGEGTYFHYPSDYESAMTILALDNTTYATGSNPRGYYSNYGSEASLSAPGSYIVSTLPVGYSHSDVIQDGYGRKSGTSMAAPVVSGVAAMLFYADPTLTAAAAQSVLESTAVDVNTEGWDKYTGYGCVDALAAVTAVAPQTPLSALREALAAEGTADVVLTADVTVPGTLTVNGNKTLKSAEGHTYTLTRGAGLTGDMLAVPSGATLHLTNATLHGGGTGMTGVDGALVHVEYGGYFYLETGGLLRENHRAGDGGAVRTEGRFYLDGGEISDNSATGRGGGVYAYNRMGSITYINTGLMTRNSALNGGAIYVGGSTYAQNQRDTFYFYGGNLLYNDAEELGGEMYLAFGIARDPDTGMSAYSCSFLANTSGQESRIGAEGDDSGFYLGSGNIGAGYGSALGTNSPLYVNVELGPQDDKIFDSVNPYSVFCKWGTVEMATAINYLTIVDRDDCELFTSVFANASIIRARYKTPEVASDLATLKTLLAAEGTKLIKVDADFDITETLTVNGKKFLASKWTSGDTAKSLSRGAAFTGSGSHLLKVNAGAALNLRDITLDGGQIEAGGSLVHNLGTLDLGYKGVLQYNHSTGNGGAVLNEGLLRRGATSYSIKNNKAVLGGGIYNTGTVRRVTASSGEATSGGGVYNAAGGVIQDGGGGSGNKATGNGGGIYNAPGGTVQGSVDAQSNTAGGDGGGIYNAGTLVMTGGTIQRNTANNNSGSGGEVYAGGSVTLGGKAAIGYSNNAGLYLPEGKLLLLSEEVPLNGCAISVESTGRTLPFELTGQLADPVGMELRIRQDGWFYVSGNAGTNEVTVLNGRIVVRQKPDVSLKTFADLKAALEKAPDPDYDTPLTIGADITMTGTIAVNGEKVLSSKNGTFALARGAGFTGALLSLPSGAQLTISGVNMDGAGIANAAPLVRVEAGGVLKYTTGVLANNTGGGVLNGGSASLSSVTLQNNGTQGGAVGGVANSAGATLDLWGCKVQGNLAAAGAGLHNSGTATLKNSNSFTSNMAAGNGGGVYNAASAAFDITGGGTLEGNTAGGDGGGLYNAAEGTVAPAGTGSTYALIAKGNTAQNGGGFYNAGSMTLHSPVAVGNTVTGIGSGIYQDGALLKLSRAPIIGGVYSNDRDPKSNALYIAPDCLLTVDAANWTTATAYVGIEVGSRPLPFNLTSTIVNANTYAANFHVHDKPGYAVEGTGEPDYALRVSAQAETAVSTLDALKTTLAASGSATVTVSGNITVTETLTVNGDKLLKSGGSSTATLTRAAGFADKMMEVAASGSLAIENLTLDGASVSASGPLVRTAARSSLLRLGSGAVLKNNQSSTNGGAVYSGGALLIDGGTISNCSTTASGGGVFNYQGSMVFSSGSITGCEGGGIYYNSGSLVFSGGSVTNCTGSGIYAGGTFAMSGGTISGCSASYGGGLYIPGGNTATITGGTITGNTAASGGSGVYIRGTITLGGAPVIGSSAGDNHLAMGTSNTLAVKIDPAGPLKAGARVNVHSDAYYLPLKLAQMTDGSPVDGMRQYFHTVAPATLFEIEDGTLYLKADPAQTPVKVTYYANGGSGVGEHAGRSSVSFEYTSADTITVARVADLFARSGYLPKTPASWNTSSGGGGTAYNAGGTTRLDADLNLYAQWVKEDEKPEPVTANSITLLADRPGEALFVGDAMGITVVPDPADAEFTLTSVKSADTAVLEVGSYSEDNPYFTVKGKGEGSAKLNVEVDSGGKTRKASLTLTVEERMTGITLRPANLRLKTGQTGQLAALAKPAGGAVAGVSWESDAPDIATVQNGTVTAVAPGVAAILATAPNPYGGAAFTAVATVEVTASIGSLAFSPSTPTDLAPGAHLTVLAHVLPAAAPQEVSWSVSNPAVLGIVSTTAPAGGAPAGATIEARATGQARLCATAQDGRSVTLLVNVAVPEVTVAIADGLGAVHLYEGDTEELTLAATFGHDLELAALGAEPGGDGKTYTGPSLDAVLAAKPGGDGEWTLSLAAGSAGEAVDLVVSSPENPDASVRLRVSVSAAPAAVAARYLPLHPETAAVTVQAGSTLPAPIGLWSAEKDAVGQTGVPISLRRLAQAGSTEADPAKISFVAVDPNKTADVDAAQALNEKFILNIRDDRTLTLTALPGESGFASTYKAKLSFTPEGALNPVLTDEVVTVKVNTKLPKLSAAAVKINSFYAGSEAPLIIKGGTVKTLEVDEMPTALQGWLDTSGLVIREGDAERQPVLKVRPSAEANKKNGPHKLQLKATLEGYGDTEFKFSVTVSSTRTAPSVKLKASAVKLYMGTGEAASTGMPMTLAPKKSGDSLADMNFTAASVVTRLEGKEADTYKNQSRYVVVDNAINPVTGAFTLALKDEDTVPAKGKVLLQFEVGGGSQQRVKLAVSVTPVKVKTRVTLKPAKTTLTLNPALANGEGETYTMRVRPSVADFDMSRFVLEEPVVTSAKGAPLDDDEHGLVIGEHPLEANGFDLDIGLKPDADPGKTYKVKLVVKDLNAHMGSKPDATLTLTVKTSQPKDPELTGSVSGKIDLTKGTRATLKLAFKYTNGGVADLPQHTHLSVMDSKKRPLDGWEDSFKLEWLTDKSYALSVVPGNTEVKPGTYYIGLDAVTNTGETVSLSKPVKLSVGAAKPKVSLSAGTVNLYKANPASQGEFTLALPAGTPYVTDVMVSGANGKVYGVRPLGGGRYAIVFNEGMAGSAKSKTLTLQVFLKGNAAHTTTVKLKTKVL